MSRINETGESTASIVKRRDDQEMPRVMEALDEGAVLWQPRSGYDYYVRKGGEFGSFGALSQARIRKLEKDGVIELVGVKTYAKVRGES